MKYTWSLLFLLWIINLIPDSFTTPIMSYKSEYNVATHDYKVVCYLGSWAVYRPGEGKFPVEEINPFTCTHLIYGFAGLGYDNKIRSLDSYYDLEENYGKGAFKRFTNLKKANSKLKTLIAIGGWNEGSQKYSNMAADSGSRRVFIDSCVDFCVKYGFDGLDLDWEYPAARGGKPEDKGNFIALLRELKEEFKKRDLLLTAAVSAGKHFMDPAYDIPQVSKYLDFINVMAYDYHGGWETVTGHHAAMYSRPNDPIDERTLNLNFSVNYWINKGAAPEKLILGMGLYGRSFTLTKPEDHSIGAAAPSRGQAGPYTREPGSLGYNEICESQMREQWTIERDPHVMAPFAYRDRQWVGYDDLESIAIKAHFAKTMRLGGAMVWSIETDDFRGKCHGKKYPMLTVINDVFASPELRPLPEPTTDPSPHTTTQMPHTSTTMRSTTTMMPTTSTTPWWQSSTTPSSSKTTMMPTTSTTPWWQSSTTPSSSKATMMPTTGTTPWWQSSTTPSSSKTTMMPTTSTTPWWQSSTTSTTTMAPWSSTTPKTTTTMPDGSTKSPKLPCSGEGLTRHPNDCQKFYRCVSIGHGYLQYEYSCPADTVFDEKAKICTWPYMVNDCKNYFYNKYSFLWKSWERKK